MQFDDIKEKPPLSEEYPNFSPTFSTLKDDRDLFYGLAYAINDFALRGGDEKKPVNSEHLNRRFAVNLALNRAEELVNSFISRRLDSFGDSVKSEGVAFDRRTRESLALYAESAETAPSNTPHVPEQLIQEGISGRFVVDGRYEKFAIAPGLGIGIFSKSCEFCLKPLVNFFY